MQVEDILGVHRALSLDKQWLLTNALTSGDRTSLPRVTSETRRLVEMDMAWLGLPGCCIVTIVDDAYPAILKEIPDPPPLLFCHGNRNALASLKIAIVGSRSPTDSGVRTATQFARDFAGRGLAVASGLALGVDAAAHRGAVEARGVTIAVLGSGCDFVTPLRNRRLADKILATDGLIVSEFPLGTPPLAHHFPRRNRIVTGISLGTLVVEAALKSGSLISARLAMEQGREVFAIPGSIRSRQSHGCHQLIRQGAHLVEQPEEMLAELGALALYDINNKEPMGSQPSLSEQENAILNLLSAEPMHIDEISHRSGNPVAELMTVMVGLELKDQVISESGGFRLP